MPKDNKAADIIKAYVREHRDTPSRTIAKYLHNKHPGLFNSESACLSRVRYYRGAAGKKCRTESKGQPKFPKIPAPDRKRKRLMKLRTPGKWLILSDLHVPYHDASAVTAAVQYGIEQGCEHLLLNGDALDAYQQSRWVKDPTLRNTDSEIEKLKELLAEIAPHFPGEKVYKIGNHEERIEAYLFMNAPKMIGISKWDLGEELKKHLDIPDWTMIASKQLYKLGKLNAYHGHELPSGSNNPVNVGRGVWLRTKQSGFTSHWHSTSTHVETNGSKTKTWVCFSLGCLCDLHPDYAPVNGWNHGFAIVHIEPNGNFKIANHQIDKGEVW